MATLTYPQLTAVIAAALTASAASSGYTPTSNNTAALLDKIGKVHTLDTRYEDKLTMFDGEDLPLGRIIEEYNEDLILPADFDASGADALAPHNATYRANYYSYPIAEKTFAITKRYNDLEKAMLNDADLAAAISLLFKKQADSKAIYRYGLKRELIAKAIGLAATEQGSTTAYQTAKAYTTTSGTGSSLAPVVLQKPATAIRALVWKDISVADNTGWDALVSNGFLVPLDLITTMAKPVDEATGEDFIEQVKKDLEIAGDISQGHSLNGNALGISDAGYVLVLRQGVMPSLEARVMAGAFHEDKIALPAEVVTIPDFGSADSSYYAVLIDKRMLRLHRDYEATRPQDNGKGDFMTMYAHMQHTPFISRNTFIKVYKAN